MATNPVQRRETQEKKRVSAGLSVVRRARRSVVSRSRSLGVRMSEQHLSDWLQAAPPAFCLRSASPPSRPLLHGLLSPLSLPLTRPPPPHTQPDLNDNETFAQRVTVCICVKLTVGCSKIRAHLHNGERERERGKITLFQVAQIFWMNWKIGGVNGGVMEVEGPLRIHFTSGWHYCCSHCNPTL